ISKAPAAAAAPVSVETRAQPAPVAATPAAAVPVSQPASVAAPAVSREELTKFAIEYVIEQTGYPEELVELDANLEADLGIDSIRKAQLLGEIAEQFDMKFLAS